MDETKKFNLRMPLDLQEETKTRADAMGVSFNAYCLMAIRNFNAFTADKTWAGGRRTARLAAAAVMPPAATAKGVRVRITGSERNLPCPCGSGVKAKRCPCLGYTAN